jgi:hypothetical protein
MMKKICAWLVVLSIDFVSCEKEHDFTFTYPTQSKSARLENTSNVRLFTRAGEVRDQSIIKAFVARYSKDWLHYDGIKQVMPAQQGDTLEITADQIAYFKNSNGVNVYSVTKGQDGHLLFTPQQPHKITPTGGTLTTEVESDEYINAAIEKYDLVSSTKKLVPVSGGFGYEYEITVKKIAAANKHQVVFPILAYTVLTGRGFQKKIYSVNVNNRFDQSGVTQIQNTDTLAVQEFSLIYEE